MLAALAFLVAHRAEGGELLQALRKAQPWWLLLGGLLQVGTYAADARIWWEVLAAAREPRPWRELLQLSLGKYFVDQAIPTAGVTGTLLVVGALGRAGVSRATSAAALLVRLVTHFFSYGMVLAAGLWVAHDQGRVPRALLGLPALFATGLVAGAILLVLAMRRPSLRVPARLARLRPVRMALEVAREAPASLAHDPVLLARSTLWQTSVFALDTATLWVCLAAVGARVGATAVFGALMLASVVRSAGGVPGGVGTFDAASVAALAAMGVPLGPALLGTLLFRGLSFWLPLLPGMLTARRISRR